MEASFTFSQLLVITPILGACLGFFFRKKPKILMAWLQALAILELILVFILSGFIKAPTSIPLAFIMTLSAALVILGRHLDIKPAYDLFEVLVLTGLGLGFLLNDNHLGSGFLIGVFALLITIQLRTEDFSNRRTRWVSGLYGAAILLIILSFSLTGANKHLVLFLAYATLLPLFPLHGAYISLLNGLSGVLPAFLALYLPALGLYGLLPVLPLLPPGVRQIVLLCAILGVIIASLRSLVQARIPQVLAQTALVFWSILWWSLSHLEINIPASIIFSSAISLALCGLFLASHELKGRYGDLNLDCFGGLVSVMPRFSILFSLLIMAAMGLPFFGVFSGFIALAFSPSMAFSWSFIIILGSWFFASWRFPTLMQKTLFGKPNPGWVYRDLGFREVAALSLILIILLILGIAPYSLLGIEHSVHLSSETMGAALWNR